MCMKQQTFELAGPFLASKNNHGSSHPYLNIQFPTDKFTLGQATKAQGGVEV